jgi:uncharacterized Zn-binding protein involved in type VI secretion
MPPSHRFTDICTGHGSFPPRPTASGSPDTFVNSLDQMRVGDPYIPHGSNSPSGDHGGNVAEGSPDVFTNSLPSGRIGDPVTCGGCAATGSGNVIIN